MQCRIDPEGESTVQLQSEQTAARHSRVVPCVQVRTKRCRSRSCVAGPCKFRSCIGETMPMNTAYRELRANGDIFVALGLAGCLLFSNWPLTALSIFLFLLFVTSYLRSILHSIENYNFLLFKTYRGVYYNAKILYTALL